MASSESSTASTQNSTSYQQTVSDSGNTSSYWTSNLSDVGNYTVNLSPPVTADSGVIGPSTGKSFLPLLVVVVVVVIGFIFFRKSA